jgi:hypothetical protein
MNQPSEARSARDLALAKAAEEYGLQDYYIECVKPLLGMPKEQWPMCCGGGCEPCNGTLAAVADRTLELEKLAPT